MNFVEKLFFSVFINSLVLNVHNSSGRSIRTLYRRFHGTKVLLLYEICKFICTYQNFFVSLQPNWRKAEKHRNNIKNTIQNELIRDY